MGHSPAVPARASHEVLIRVPPSRVWEALTVPSQMKEWMAEPDVGLEIATSWHVGSPITLRGVHTTPFVNTGSVLRFEPPCVLAYTHLSSLSHLPDEPQSYTAIEFVLTATGTHTHLVLTLTAFPTESVFKHLDFYWRVTLQVLRDRLEGPEGPDGVQKTPG